MSACPNPLARLAIPALCFLLMVGIADPCIASATLSDPGPATGSLIKDHVVTRGDTLWDLARQYSTTVTAIAHENGIDPDDCLQPGETLRITAPRGDASSLPAAEPSPDMKVHVVVRGDTLYDLAILYGTSVGAIASENRIDANAMLRIGQKLRIPGSSHDDAADQKTAISSRGESRGAVAVPWEKANVLFPRGAVALVTEIKTGLSFEIKRYGGTLHADVEPLTRQDTEVMRRIWGGWSWARKPVVFEYDGYRIAASMNGQPHGREIVGNNGIAGHVCLHFLNSRLHCNRRLDPEHQQAVRAAVGK